MFASDRAVGAFVRKYCLEFFVGLYDGKAFCFPSLQNGQDILGSYFRCRNEFEIEPSVFESLRAGNFSVRNSLVEVRHSGIALHTTTS